MAMGRFIGLASAGAIAMVAGCGGMGANNDSPSSFGGRFSDAGFFGGPSAGFPGVGSPGASTGGASAVLPPEKEVTTSFELPQAGKNFVYAANTDSDTVAVIDAATLGIQIVQAGDQPKFLQTLAGRDEAIVLNVGSNDATIIRTDATGASRTSNVLVKPGSNAIAVAKDGRHAVVYYDSSFSTGSSTLGNSQDTTVITLDDAGDTYNGMAIGFHPTRVFFSDDSARAFFVTDDGVSILDFTAIDQKANGVSQQGSGIAKTVRLGNTGVDQTLDVSVTSDGRYALARENGDLRLVNLDTRAIQKLDLAALIPEELPEAGMPDAGAPRDSGAPLRDSGSDARADSGHDAAAPPVPEPASKPSPAPATVTDLDLAPSGAFAVAVVRERSAVVRVPIPDAFTDPSKVTVMRVPNEIIGSATLAPDERHALLYTTAIDTVKRITIADLEQGSMQTVQLRKSIESVVVAPGSQTALIVNKKLPDDPADPTIDAAARTDREYGYTLLQLDTGFALLRVTAAPLGPFALVPDGSHLLVLFNQNDLREVQNVDLGSFQMTPIELGSPPTSVGTVSGSKRAFIGQDHPDGRISLLDWTSNAIQTVTGFELNSRIRQ